MNTAEAAAALREAATAAAEAAAAVAVLQDELDALHGKTIDIGIDASSFRAAAEAANSLADAESGLAGTGFNLADAMARLSDAQRQMIDQTSRLVQAEEMADAYSQALIANAEHNRYVIENSAEGEAVALAKLAAAYRDAFDAIGPLAAAEDKLRESLNAAETAVAFNAAKLAADQNAEAARVFAEADAVLAEAQNVAAETASRQGMAETYLGAAMSDAERDALGLTTALVATSAASAASSDAANAGSRAWSAQIGWFRLTATALHWIVAGSAEFLAVAVPAAVALGAGLAVAAQGAQNVQQHFTALYDATESTANAMHTTVGDVLGLGNALQTAQNAANPGVYEILGSVVNDAKSGFSSLATTGLDVVHMFDEFSARVTVDLQQGMGAQLQGLLSGMVTDLQEFGNVLGNLGHSLLNFAAAMPGLAHVLLAVAVGLSDVIEWASRGGVLLTMAMGLEEMYRWGGLALNMLVRLTGQTAAMDALGSGGFIFRFGAALETLVAAGGRALIWAGQMVGRLAGVSEAFGTAGTAMAEAGAGAASFAESVGPMGMAGLAAAAAAVGFLTYKVITAKSATEEWAAASSAAALAKASDLNVLPTIYTQLADTATRLAGSIQATGTAFRDQSSTIKAAGDSWRSQNDTYHQAIGNNQVLAQHQDALIATANTVRGNISLLAGAFHTTAIGALALANAAGVNLQDGLTKGSAAARYAEQQITNLKTGLGAMQAPATEIGADMEAIGVQSQLASSKVSQVNQAMDAFIAGTTGGMNSVMQFNAALRAMGKDTVSTSQSITGQIDSISRTAAHLGYTLQGIGPHAQQSWQQFDAALQQGNTVLDTFRTGMAEGIVTQQQYAQEIKAVGGAMLPFAAHSGTALHMVSQLAQELGLPATGNLKTLASEFGITGKAAQNMATVGMEQAVARMSNLNLVARNLSVTISSQLDTAMASAIVKASGLDTAYTNWASAVEHNAAPQTLSRDLAAVNRAQAMVNTGMAEGTKLLNQNSTAANSLGSAYKSAGGSTTDFATHTKDASAALNDTIARARDAGSATTGFGQQAHTAGAAATGLSANANQANTAVRALGTSANTTRGSLGTVNNEIRVTASAAGSAQGPLMGMANNINAVGSSAAAAAGQVRGLEAAIASLQSRTITVTTNMVTTHTGRQSGGPVAAGIPYTVGEAGRETFVPYTSGYILPHEDTERFLASPGGHGPGGGGVAGMGGPVHLTATLHNVTNLDGEQVFANQQMHTLIYDVRNGIPQQGRVAGGPVG